MKNPETPLEGGFPWKHGVERDTTGTSFPAFLLALCVFCFFFVYFTRGHLALPLLCLIMVLGIWIWSKPIVRKLEDGQEVAIILVDTQVSSCFSSLSLSLMPHYQGTFDNSTTANENAKIFAINALISSLQIYNIKEKISEDILQHMHLFTEFGVTLSQKIDGSKPFQSMQVCIWPY